MLDGDQASPPKKGHSSPSPTFRLMSVVAKRSPISATAELLFHDVFGLPVCPQCCLYNVIVNTCVPHYFNLVSHSKLLLFVGQAQAAQLVATRVTLSTSDLPADVGVQHLWVCDSSDGSCRVSIVSLHTNEPCVVESFHVADVIVVAVETVPGYNTSSSDKFAFTNDTVWMATEDER